MITNIRVDRQFVISNELYITFDVHTHSAHFYTTVYCDLDHFDGAGGRNAYLSHNCVIRLFPEEVVWSDQTDGTRGVLSYEMLGMECPFKNNESYSISAVDLLEILDGNEKTSSNHSSTSTNLSTKTKKWLKTKNRASHIWR